MGEVIGSLMALSVILPLYLIPTMVASWRNHHQTKAIFALNLLLGWIIALIWALTATAADRRR